MSRNNPTTLHRRAQRDDIHGGPPAKWPRREADRPGVVRRSRGHGRGVGPSLLNLHAPPSKRGVNTLQNHRASSTKVKRGWYRSKSGTFHYVRRKDGTPTCGVEFLRVAGPYGIKAMTPTQQGRMCDTCKSKS